MPQRPNKAIKALVHFGQARNVFQIRAMEAPDLINQLLVEMQQVSY